MVRTVTNHLVGNKETATLLGVSRQRLAQLLNEHEDFPEPVARLAATPVWARADVEAWARKHGRSVHPLLEARPTA
jgi:predicted DNA-binding transcriptional regulator AlpA